MWLKVGMLLISMAQRLKLHAQASKEDEEKVRARLRVRPRGPPSGGPPPPPEEELDGRQGPRGRTGMRGQQPGSTARGSGRGL